MGKQEVRTMKRFAYLSVTILMLMVLAIPLAAFAAGATQFLGITFYAGPRKCTDPEGAGAIMPL